MIRMVNRSQVPLESRSLSDAQGPEANRVSRDTVIPHAVPQALDGRGPLSFRVEVAVNTGVDACRFQALDTRPGRPSLVERRIMPEDVQRHPRRAERGSLSEGLIQGKQFRVGARLRRVVELLHWDRAPSCATDDHAAHFESIPTYDVHRRAHHRSDRLDLVEPAIVIPRGENLGPRQAGKPGEIRLEVTVAPSHRKIARQEHKVASSDDRTPFSLDPVGMVLPARGVTLAAVGQGKREVKICDGPDGQDNPKPRLDGCGDIRVECTNRKRLPDVEEQIDHTDDEDEPGNQNDRQELQVAED